MKKLALYLSMVVMTLCPKHAEAWGKKGHQIVAEIGFDLLDTRTQDSVKKYLGHISVRDAGTWMDDMRNNPAYAYLKPWHYVNTEPGATYEPAAKGDVVSELTRVIEELKHRETLGEAEIQMDLLVLFHLAGDIAQPLHVGYGSDMGGNNIDVIYVSKPSNLHKVWDTEIIESEKINTENCKSLLSTLSDEKRDVISVVDPMAWMNYSRKLLPRVYKFTGDTIDRNYVRRNKIIIRKQLLYAGVRLAATLESIFNPPVATPAAIKTVRGLDTVTLQHLHYRSHFVNSAHIPWVVEYTLHASDVNCADALARSNRFAPDPYNKAATDLENDYKGSGYDRGHNMPAADNGCNGPDAMRECFYFSNMFPQTHRLNAGVWRSLEMRERDLAASHDSIYVWIGSFGVTKTIGKNKVVVPEQCWKVIYDYSTQTWESYIFPNTTTVSGKPDDFLTTVEDIEEKTGFVFE